MACCTMVAGQQGGAIPVLKARLNKNKSHNIYRFSEVFLKFSSLRVIPMDTGAGAGSMAL